MEIPICAALFLLVLSTAGVANAQDDPTVETEVKAYIRCADTSSSELDDMISDASTIAIGIQSYCGKELDALARRRGLTRAEWERALNPHVVATVLANRVKSRKLKRK